MPTTPWSTRSLLAFLPYAVVSIIDIVAEALGDSALAGDVKPWLMPLLALPLILFTVRRSLWTAAVATVALLLAWLGDVAGDFIVMLAFFLGMQVVYIVLFARFVRVQRVKLWSIVYAAWWIALLALVGPNAGALLIPVAVYGLALGAMAVLATGSHLLVTIGAAVFLLSDSLLGLAHFVPAFSFAGHDAVVMLTYCAGQLLIALGVIAVVRARALPAAVAKERPATA